jgi:hypothetical protein
MKKTASHLIAAICIAGALGGCDPGPTEPPNIAALYDDNDCTSQGECAWPATPEVGYASLVEKFPLYNVSSGQDSLIATSYSQPRSNAIYSSRVEAVSYTYRDCRTSNKQEHLRASKTSYGLTTASVRLRFIFYYTQSWGYQVVAQHIFVPTSGAGGGTFSSEASRCHSNSTY